MKHSNLPDTILTLSQNRLESYRTYFSLNTDEECLGVYLWNDSLSSAFFKIIGIFEIAFRNMLHRELSSLFYAHRTQGTLFDNDWYNHLASSGIINQQTISILKKTTHHKVSVRAGSTPTSQPKNPPPLPGKVVSAQTIGFWIKLIETTRTSIDWKTVFFKGFKGHFARYPSYWNTRSVDDLLIRLEQVAELRDRVAHHEPLWKFTEIVHPISGQQIYPFAQNPSESILRMSTLHHRLTILLGWISQDRKNDYLHSHYSKNFNWLCREETIENFKKISTTPKFSISITKRNLSKILKNNSIFEITSKNSSMLIFKNV